jgi:hypothetical protein
VRTYIGLALVGFGVFVLAAGGFTRFQIAPEVVAAPQNMYQLTEAQAQNATYFDAGSLQKRTGATLNVSSTLRGDVKAARGNVVVWDNTTVIQDLANNVNVDIRTQRLAFDRHNGQLTQCCGAHVGNDKNVKMSGIALFWPLQMERKDYQGWDATTQRTWPLKFSGTETVNGVSTYKFVQTIPATKVASTTPEAPANLLGLPGTASVPVDRFYQAQATFWIDRRTGVTVDQRQQVRSSMRGQNGQGELLLADFDLQLTPKSKAALKDKVDQAAVGSMLLKTIVPLACLVAGLALVIGGVALAGGRPARHRRGTQRAVPAAS